MKDALLIEAAAQWDAATLELPTPHVLQSWTWGEFKSRYGWRPQRWLWQSATGQPQAAAQVLVQRRGPRSLGYAPKGPLLDWRDLERVEATLAALESYTRRNGMFLLKIDPDVREDTPEGQAVIGLLRRRKWSPSFEQIQFRNTMLLDLRPNLDALMEQMKSKWRYNVRLAVRRGGVIREAQEADLPLLYAMYQETAQRDNFIIREAAYYLDAWRAFMRQGQALPLLAEVEGEPVAMLVLFYFGKAVWYMYGASRNIYREYMPNHLLQWAAIRRVKELGCETYDLWGAPDVLEESDPLWGVYRFKEGLGAEFAPHIGAYDYAPQPLLYRLYARLRPPLIALAQRRYWRERGKG